MVQFTPLVGIPWVEPGDFPNQYPTTSEQLADIIDAWLTPMQSTGFSTGGISDVTSPSCFMSLYRPTGCFASFEWSQGPTEIPAGAAMFDVGTLDDPVFWPYRRAVGSYRHTSGGGICEIDTQGMLTVRAVTGTVTEGAAVYASFAYETVPVALTTLPRV